MFANLPLLTGLYEQGRDQSQTASFIWKNTYHSCAPANLLINLFQTVGCADHALVFRWKVKDCESFCRVLLHPGRQAWG